jgi:uncharacterized delta-60 repeat protein
MGFSGDGKQTTDFGGGFNEGATGVALQANGKIVAVGSVGAPGGDFALARYNPGGSLDASFSGDGKETTDFGGDELATAMALQGDGKIIVVGQAGADDRDFALARFNPNGTLDTSFSGDGKETTDLGGGSDLAQGVALQGDGKIVVAGFAGTTSPNGDNFGDFALARYNPDGSLDTTFSGDGKQTTDFGVADFANGVAIQGDGKIVAVGDTDDDNFALARYNTDGSPDTSFSGDGKQTTDFGGFDEATAVALQGDGKIVAIGDTNTGDFDFALARYTTGGSLDTSFSGDGKQTTDFAGSAAATAVALQANGRIVAVGGNGDFALARYKTNGSLDPSFSGDGRQTTEFGRFGNANGVALQANGKIVVAGAGGSGNFALARYNTGGSLDTTFSGDGKQATDFGGEDEAIGVALQANGKIVAAGVAGLGLDRTEDFALARYLGG